MPSERIAAGLDAGECRAGRFGAGLAPAPTVRPRRSSPPAPWRWSAAPRPLPRHRCAWRGSAPPARRACCRPAGSARRGTNGRFLRRSPAGTRRPDGFARPSRLSGLASLATRPTRPSCDVQHRPVHRVAVQTFGGVEFERVIDAQHVAEQTSATMLAAISTTILSRRSCAETCSAMVSRSRPARRGGLPTRSACAGIPPRRSNPPDGRRLA